MASNPKKSKSGRPSAGQRTVVRKGADQGSLARHKLEIVALVLLGVAIFLFVALFAGQAAGAGGRGVRTALVFALGNLAFLVPLALVVVAVTLVLQRGSWGTQRYVGIGLFVAGLFILVAAGAPPVSSHPSEAFARSVYESRAGALGEAIYVGLYKGIGTVGVAIVGWLAVLSGFILATGVTGHRVAARTGRAADAVRKSAERNSLAIEEEQDGRTGGEEGSKPWPGWVPAQRPADGGQGRGIAKVHLGPVDLVEQASRGALPGAGVGSGDIGGDPFEEWSLPHSVQTGTPGAHGGTGATMGGGVLDGERAFSDLYQDAPQTDSAVGQVVILPLEGGGQKTLNSRGATGATSAEDVTEEAADGASASEVAYLGEHPAYLLPEAGMLRKSAVSGGVKAGGERDVAAVLVESLAQFGVEARVIGMVVGPRVTRYELQLAPGTKVAKVTGLRDDLAYALASTEIRILAPIPGKSAVGVEVPNQRPDFVTLGDIYKEFPKSAGPLMVWLGKDISGKAVYADLTKLPHLLIAGTTGSGKSGCVNCLVSSVLLRSTPEQVRMIMVDPKKVELSHYDRIPHLLVPVVTNMKDAAGVLHNVVKEMEDRYELLELDHTRSLAEANKVRAQRGESPLPYILIVIDELADLMMTSPQEVEDYVIRLAQKSRAVGIHLVVATQRPSADVITGMIKANIPSRIAFAVSSQTDSRVILDVNGAESLLGMGDMLFKPLGSSHLQRVQGAYITEEEIASLVSHWRHQAEPEFREELLRRPPDPKKSEAEVFDPDSDELLAEAAQLVLQTGSASVSMLQRRLRVGYTRAGRLIDMLERRGIVGPYEGSKPRQILIHKGELEDHLESLRLEGQGGETATTE